MKINYQKVTCGVETQGSSKGLHYCQYEPVLPPIVGIFWAIIIIPVIIIAIITDRYKDEK